MTETKTTERERVQEILAHEEDMLRQIAARRREIAVAATLGVERARHEARVLDSDEAGHRSRAELARVALEVLEDA